MLHYNHSTIGDSHSFVLHCSPWERLFILYFYRTSGKTWALKLQQASPRPSLLEDLFASQPPSSQISSLSLRHRLWEGDKEGALSTSPPPFPVGLLANQPTHYFSCTSVSVSTSTALGHVFVCINLRHATNQWWVTFVFNIRSKNQHIIIIIITFMISVTCSPSDLNVPMEFKYWWK